MSNLTDFFPSAGGGGGAVGSLSLQTEALDANTFVDSNGSTWLKSGIVETNTSLYPNLTNKFGAIDIKLGNPITGVNYFAYGYDSSSNNLYATVNNYSHLGGNATGADIYEINESAYTAGSNLKASMGNQSKFSTNSISDGTTDWVLKGSGYTNTTGTRSQYNAGNYPQLNVFQFVPVTGGSWISSGGFTFGTPVSLSGAPTSIYGYVVGSIAATSTHFYVTALNLQRGAYDAWYYNFDSMIGAYGTSNWSIYKFTKAGAYVSTLRNYVVVHNSVTSSDTVYFFQLDKTVSGTQNLPTTFWNTAANSTTGVITKLNNDASATADNFTPTDYTYINVQGGGYGMVFSTPTALYAINSYRYLYQTRTTFGYYNGLIPAQYARGITTDTAGTQTGSSVGPTQTSEYLQQIIYIKAT